MTLKHYRVSRSSLNGEMTIPSSKSHTMRAILFATMAEGVSHISQYLHSPDTDAMIAACRQLGAEIVIADDLLTITGVAGKPSIPMAAIDSGNSGQVLRFIAAIAGLLDQAVIVTGDESICSNRPVLPLIEALQQLGCQCKSIHNNSYAPIEVLGPLHAGETTLDGKDSQPVSALLIAAMFVEGETIINVEDPGEKPWIDLTLSWLKKFGVNVSHENYQRYNITGNHAIQGFDYTVPADMSSLAFPVVAALITDSTLTIKNVDMDDVQGDKAIITTLQSMGANIAINKDVKCLTIHAGSQLQGKELEINDYIDAVTILAVVGCYAKGQTIISGAAIARQKESDRITAIATELTKMGADVIEKEDGLIINHSQLKGAMVGSHHDHRIAMSLAVAGMNADGETIIHDVNCVKKSFPGFVETMRQVNAKIEEYDE